MIRYEWINRILLGVLVVLMVCPASFGQAPDTKAKDISQGSGFVLDETIVTASRRQTPVAEAPVKANIIGSDQIERSTARAVDELLREIPGISYMRTHFSECGPGREITLRGINGQKRTLVLVDGIPMNDGLTGAVNWSQIPKEMIQRIEIVPGPMSALYGSGAMGGVIHIITRKPGEKSQTGFTAEYGSLNTRSFSGFHLSRAEKIGGTMGGRVYESDGYTSVVDPQAYHTDTEREEQNLFGTLSFYPDEVSVLTAGLNHVNEDYNRGRQTDNQVNRKTVAHLTYKRDMDQDSNLSGSLYAQFINRAVELGSPRSGYAVQDNEEEEDSYKVGQVFKVNFDLSGPHNLTAGIDSSLTKMEKEITYYTSVRDGKAQGKQSQFSMFAQDEMSFDLGADKLIVTLGIRGDYTRSFDGESLDTNLSPGITDYDDKSFSSFNPKLGLVYEMGDRTVFRLSGGRSFAAPTLFELYTVFSRGPYVLYGNPDLDAETAYSVELGADHWLTDSLLGRMSVYYTLGHDFITNRATGTFTDKYDNVNKISAMGLDLDFDYRISREWSLFGWYKCNLSEVEEDQGNAANEGNRLPFEPDHRAKIGVICRILDPVVVEAGLRYEGDRYTNLENSHELDEYVTLDVSVSGTVGEHFKWKLAGENLFDQKYDIYAIPNESESESPGILTSFSISYNF